jgi:hypothetical protein
MHWVDPDCLPAISGTMERFIVNPHGEVDGLVVMRDDGALMLVHTPPHLETDITAALTAGHRVSVRGIRPRGADLVAAVALTAEDGRTIVDEGPDRDRKDERRERSEPKRKLMEAAGAVRLSLFGPKGELRGALLADGIAVRVDPKAAKHCAALLRPGAALAARGDGLLTAYGRVIPAKEIGSDLSHLHPVKPPKRDEKKDHGKKHKPDKHGVGRRDDGEREPHAHRRGTATQASG